MFDGTNQDFVKQRANEEINSPKFGIVSQVFEHLNAEDNSNFECNVIVDGEDFEDRALPYIGGHSDHIAAPKVGEKVLMLFREGENSRPVLIGMGYTNRDRAPVARSGMYRDVYESEGSPTGLGDIKVTGYTEYSDNPAIVDEDSLVPERAWYQISKEVQTPDPSDPTSAPMVMEMFDSPGYADDASHIKLQGNQVDGDDTKSLDVTLDFKAGTAEIRGTNSNGEFGISIDVNTGEFTLIDESGYGIESDGSGNFTWHHESIDFSEGTTTSL